MPLSPSAQLFSNTPLADNPILSAILFLSQRQQDIQDRAKADEQLKLENQRADQEFKLKQEELKLRQAAQQNALQSQDIARRQADFGFRTGATNIPEAIISGGLPTELTVDPIMAALAPQFTEPSFKPVETTNPITGEPLTVSPQSIESILAAEDTRQQQKLAGPLLQIQAANQRELFRAQNTATQNRLNRQARADIQKMVSDDRALDRQSRERAAQIRAAGGSGTELSNLDNIIQTGVRPTVNLGESTDFWTNLSGVDRGILSGTLDAKEVLDAKGRAEFANNAGKLGLVIPNFDKQDLHNYAGQKTAYLQMIDLADKFAQQAPVKFEGLGSAYIGRKSEDVARAIGHSSIATFDQMNGLAETLRGITGTKGVMTDKDIDRVKKLLPTYEDSPSQKATKIKQLKEILQNNENSFFGAIPKPQKEFMFSANGIPEGESNTKPVFSGSLAEKLRAIREGQ